VKRAAMKRSARPMNKTGRRTNDWRKAWRFLRPRLEAAGRIRCEFSFIPHKCSRILDPAHSKKRGKMQGNDIYTVAIACRTVHTILDYQMSHEEMEQAVLRAIENHGGMIAPRYAQAIASEIRAARNKETHDEKAVSTN